MKNDIRDFFTKEAVVNSLQRLPEIKTKVLDLIYPESARITHPLPTVRWETLSVASGNSYITVNGSQTFVIHPHPISTYTIIDAATANTLMQMTDENVQQMIDNRINLLRNALRMETEALCVQVLTGKVSYPIKTNEGAMLSYDVDYGKVTSITVSKKWDAQDTKIADIVKSLVEIKSAMAKNCYGSDVIFLAGIDVYSTLIDKAAGTAHSLLIQPITEGIQIGNISIKLFEASYKDLNTGNLVSGIPEKTVVAFDRAAGHKLFYASIDDLDANFSGLPIFIKSIKLDDPSGYKIIGTSKPLPCVNVKGIVTARVLT